MIPLTLQLFDEPDGTKLLDASNATVCELDNGPYGFRSLTCFVPMVLAEAYIYYDQAPDKWVELNFGVGVVWEGRVEDRKVVTGGLELVVFGAWQAMYDLPYTALWSVSGTAGWENVIGDDIASVTPEKFEADTNNRLYAAPRKNESQSTATGYAWVFKTPDGSSRDIVGMSFDYEINTSSATWILRVDRWQQNFAYQSTVATISGNSSGSVNFTFSGTEMPLLLFRYNSGTPVTPTTETGAAYIKITNIRLVTTTANRANTTTTTTISAGSQVVTPASMANIYVGQRLFIDSGSSPSESVVVTAVTSTTFTATFANGYSGTTTIQAHVVYADEIVKDLVAHVVADNQDQLNSSTALIESPGLDLLDEVYEDEWPGDIATKLAGLGDNQGPPRLWEVGVWENRQLHFRPRGSAGRSWAVDVPDHEVNSTLENLRNSAYGVYADANGRVLRTDIADDDASQRRYGIIRRLPVSAQTTSNTQASTIRDAALEDQATIRPRSAISPELLMDENEAIFPKWLCRSGDKVTIRNLPPTLSQDIDRIRTFLVAEASYDWLTDELGLVPEQPVASLEVLLARREEGF